MVKQLQISLIQQTFQPGSEVSGTLSFETEEPKGYQYIMVSLIGRAHISWTVHENHGGAGHHGHHSGHHGHHGGHHEHSYQVTGTREYVNLQVVVWSKEQSCDGKLHSGHHNFPFQFTIPNQRLPSSFGGRKIGNIRYFVEGRITTGLLKFDRVVEAEFPLVEVVDINLPELQRRIGGGVQKTICCWFCASGPITLTAEGPRKGYCIGEAIPLTVTVNNASSRRIQASVKLQQLITYRAQGRVGYDRTSVLHLSSGPMRERSTVWLPEIIVPLETVPTLASCDIITVEYILVVKAVIPSAINTSIKIPLTIGNTPFREVSSLDPPPEVPLMTHHHHLNSPHTHHHHLNELPSYPPPSSELTSYPPPAYGLALQYQ